MRCSYRCNMWCNCKKPAKPYPVNIDNFYPTEASLEPGYGQTVAFSYSPTDRTPDISLTTNDESVAYRGEFTYDNGNAVGAVYAAGPGQTTVTLTNNENPEQVFTIDVTVSNPGPEQYTITGMSTSGVYMDSESQSDIAMYYSPSDADAYENTQIWSDDDAVAGAAIASWSEGTAQVYIYSHNPGSTALHFSDGTNTYDVDVIVEEPIPPVPEIPNNSMYVIPTRGDAIVRFFATDGNSRDYVEASIHGANELQNVSYHGICGGNTYCEEMFSNHTVSRYLGRALSDYIDEYGIPADGMLYFSREVYDSVEDYFAGEISAAQLGRDIRDAESAIVPDEPGEVELRIVGDPSPTFNMRAINVFFYVYPYDLPVTATAHNITTGDTYNCDIIEYHDIKYALLSDPADGGYEVIITDNNGHEDSTSGEVNHCVDDPCSDPDCPNYDPSECSCPARFSDPIDETEIDIEEDGCAGIGFMVTYECESPDYSEWTYESDDDSVATVMLDTEMQEFTVCAAGEGSCNITVSDGESTYTVPVVISPISCQVEVAEVFDVSVAEGGTEFMNPVYSYDCPNPDWSGLTLSCDDENVATVTFGANYEEIEINGLSTGTCTATLDDGLNGYSFTITVGASVESVSFPELEDYGEGNWGGEAYYDSESGNQSFDTILEYSPEGAAWQNLVFSGDENRARLDSYEDGEGIPHIYGQFDGASYATIEVYDESGNLLANLDISADAFTPIQGLYFDDQKTETEANIIMAEDVGLYIDGYIDVWFDPSWITDPYSVLKITSDNDLPYDFWITTECIEGGCPEDGVLTLELSNDPEYYSITSDTVRIFDINADEQSDSPLAILNVTIEWPQEEPCLEWSQTLNPQFNPGNATLFFYACDTENLDGVAINDDTGDEYPLDIDNDYHYDQSTNCYAYVSDLPKGDYTFEIHSLGSTITTAGHIETNCDMYPCSDPDCPGYSKCGNANFIEAYNPNGQSGSVSMKVMYEDGTNNYVSITGDRFMPTIELSGKYEGNEDVYWMFDPEGANITSFMMQSTEHCNGGPEGNLPCYYEFTDEARGGISEFIDTGSREAFTNFIRNMGPDGWIVPARIHNRIVCNIAEPDYSSFMMSEASDDEGNSGGILWQVGSGDHIESSVDGELAQNPGAYLLQTVLDGLTVQEFSTIMAGCEEGVMYKLIPAIFDKMSEILTSEPDAGMQDEAQALLATLQDYAQRGESILLDPNGGDDPEEPSYLEFQQTTDEGNGYIENNSSRESAVLLNILEPYTPHSSSDIVLDPHRTEDFSGTIQTAYIDQNGSGEYPFRIAVRMGGGNYSQLANGTKIATIGISSSGGDYLGMVDVYKNCYNCQ